MALSTQKLVTDDARQGSTLRLLLLQHNLILNQMRVIAAALDADAGLNIDNDYASTLDADTLRLLSNAGTDVEITV